MVSNAYAEARIVIECNDNGTQQELNACALKGYKASDQALNEKYQKVMHALNMKQRHMLRQEQRLWIKQRDYQCKQEAKDSEGGSIWPLVYYGCLDAVTKQRTKALGK